MSEKKEPEKKAEQPKLNLYQKLIEIRKQAVYLKKDANGYNFQYASGSSVIGALREKMDELGVILKPEIMDVQVNGNIVQIKMDYIWINAEQPEEIIVVPWFAIGQQKDPSQAFGSALTYSERYFLLKFFVIPTDKDDPDARSGETAEKSKQQPPKQAPSNKPQQSGEKKDMIDAEMVRKIEAACLWAADFNPAQAVEYYHLWCNTVENGKVTKTAPAIDKCTLKQAYYFWGQRIKPAFEKEGWDIDVALHEYDEWLANGKKRREAPSSDDNLPF